MRFSEVVPKAIALVEAEAVLSGVEVTLIRDLYGRIRVAVPDTAPDDPAAYRRFAQQFQSQMGAFSPGWEHIVLHERDMFAAKAVFNSPDRIPIFTNRTPPTFLLDRQVTGQDWTRAPLSSACSGNAPKRVTFFGVKGGVGRSTTLAVLALRLARLGKRVLVVDLDLESPGIGRQLLPNDRLPDFGVVDWFVEAAVGQADEALAREMAARSPLIGDDEPGEILVVPAAGRDEHDYLAKLSRAYLEVKAAGAALHFGERLNGMLGSLESSWKPDVVLLDSRAGMHDIAAVTVTRLNALALLFAVDSDYTWDAYRLLFQHWRCNRTLLAGFRDNLRMVAGLVPETDRPEYFASFRQHAYQLFTDYVYDPVDPDTAASDGADAFAFDLMSDSAPHDFLHVNWSRAVFAADLIRDQEVLDDGLLQGAFGAFFERAAELILGSPVKWS